MSIWHIVMLSAGAVAASTIGSQAGPCSAEIYSMEARVDATLKAKAADGPTLRVSREALLHRQPTPGSIAAAESRLGTASPQRIDTIHTVSICVRPATTWKCQVRTSVGPIRQRFLVDDLICSS